MCIPPAVCRKAQLLDLDRLQVDPPLDAFVRKLQCEGRQAAAAQQPTQPQPAAAAVRQSPDDSDDELAVQPMAVDGEPSSEGQAEPGPASAASAEVLSVEAMDAVLRYLHFEHAQQEAQRAQQGQEGSAEPGLVRPAAAAAAQRAASQPLAIGTRSAQQQDEMEVECKPSAHSSLLAASEAQQEQQQSAKAAVAVPAPARARPPAAPQPRPSAARPPAAPAPKLAAAVVVAQAPAPQVVLMEQQQPSMPSMPASGEPPLLPPQRPEDQGKLTVCLDLDGTLVSTFTPKRAPVGRTGVQGGGGWEEALAGEQGMLQWIAAGGVVGSGHWVEVPALPCSRSSPTAATSSSRSSSAHTLAHYTLAPRPHCPWCRCCLRLPSATWWGGAASSTPGACLWWSGRGWPSSSSASRPWRR